MSKFNVFSLEYILKRIVAISLHVSVTLKYTKHIYVYHSFIKRLLHIYHVSETSTGVIISVTKMRK